MQAAYRGPCIGVEEIEKSLEEVYSYGWVAVDTETVSLKVNEVVGIGLSFGPHSYYFPVFPEAHRLLMRVTEIVGDPRITKVYFNAMFDLRVLYNLAYYEGYAYPDTENIEDVSIMGQVMGLPHSLDSLSTYLFKEQNPLTISMLLEECGIKGATMLDVPIDKVAQKCMWDAEYTSKCWAEMQVRMRGLNGPLDCYDVDRKLVSVLLRIEKKGLKLDPNVLETHYGELKVEVRNYETMAESMGFRISSPAEVGYVLATRGNVLPFTKSGKQLRTDEEALQEIKDDPLAPMILDYRKKSKLLSTYVEPFRGKDRIQTHFRIDLATGRLASYDRNMQNIPPSMRDIFVSDNGVFSWMDYSQIEMRLFAFMSQDPVMMEAYKEGRDIHAITQLALWPGSNVKDEGKRLVAKTFNFAMIYNAGVRTLSIGTKLPEKTCSEFRKRWLSTYSGGHQYMREQMRRGSERDWVESGFGRRMRLPVEYGMDSHIEKCSINYPIQGTAADVIKRAMLRIDKECDLRLQVHDELVVCGMYEFPEVLSSIHPHIPTPFNQYNAEKWK